MSPPESWVDHRLSSLRIASVESPALPPARPTCRRVSKWLEQIWMSHKCRQEHDRSETDEGDGGLHQRP
jgi:hypothetical protein